MNRAIHATAVEEIEGIGESFGARLREAGITTIIELLAARSEVLATVTDVRADGERLARWKSAARLMLLHGVTAQWAEALVRGGISDVSDLASAELSELRAVFETAREEGIIPEPPTDDDICNMIRAAAISSHTGHLSGTVATAEGIPVAEARVQLGRRVTATDDAGRFFLDCLPLGRTAPLQIVALTGEMLTVESPRVISDSLVYTLERFQMPGSYAPKRPPRLYDELSGDRLPQVSAPLRIVRRSRAREGDILRVTEVDEHKQRALLVSLFRSYYQGSFYADSYRAPFDRLPADVAVGRHLRIAATGLAWVEMTPAILLRTKVALQALSMVRDRPGDSEEQRSERRKERNRMFVQLLRNTASEVQP